MQAVTLETLAGGALPELFAEELARVLANLADPNMSSAAARTAMERLKDWLTEALPKDVAVLA